MAKLNSKKTEKNLCFTKKTRPVLDRFHDSSKVNALCSMLYALCSMLGCKSYSMDSLLLSKSLLGLKFIKLFWGKFYKFLSLLDAFKKQLENR
jgi:hypothetical protein